MPSIPIEPTEPPYDITGDDIRPIKRDSYMLSFGDTFDNEHLKVLVKLTEDESEEFYDGLLSLIDRYK